MSEISNQLENLSYKAQALADQANQLASTVVETSGGHSDFLIFGITVLVLACFVGYYVVWSVTPALHSPLMGVTNAISSVIIVGALLAAGPIDSTISKYFGLFAVGLASVNIFGGFVVTNRMLSMFKKKS
ncbi:MAG: NAD(P) transhydrogenase subunit alpha [Alphaproteobacteria bacterium]|jgi:NAD(P) transhydrogenase subunit alpha|nr:NAD(P) transhydrogenase subunit alpha [Alphaproteobacteria bacterium]MDB3974311.1 NAD(P) transhydrogenase subunit alpha [Alphaproteobacteria bacterium]MDC0595045.1 NAD(P) transhydrogenase subunit alpha [Alphaproteobacteria bacterium]MDG2165789.1 NAD(P) transhydrogenase subunit alpha [Alphaproteobacteria bacterium]OUX22878.1 MAG: NAD(P) transhydrogenase subunit alpha part 2 [Pelagibacteraceae bacterium TMED259]|tara:strand:+ start:717 stop:1106 length:390 start_codon:yes stop_codon:yes gene_type:complete